MNLNSWQSADYNLWLLIPLLILGYSLLNAFVLWRLKPLWPKAKSWRIIGVAITIFFVIVTPEIAVIPIKNLNRGRAAVTI